MQAHSRLQSSCLSRSISSSWSILYTLSLKISSPPLYTHTNKHTCILTRPRVSVTSIKFIAKEYYNKQRPTTTTSLTSTWWHIICLLQGSSSRWAENLRRLFGISRVQFQCLAGEQENIWVKKCMRQFNEPSEWSVTFSLSHRECYYLYATICMHRNRDPVERPLYIPQHPTCKEEEK